MGRDQGNGDGCLWGSADEDKYVHYGDFIAFAGAQQGGFVGADSVLSDTLFFERLDDHREHDIADMQECAFTIMPKFMYSAAKAAKKQLRETENAAKKQLRETGNSMREAPQEELDAVMRAMEDEKDTNEMELRRRAGKTVEYGSVVQLQHTLSRKFVTQLKNRAEIDTLAMEIGLRAEGEEASWWRVLSMETTRRNGEPVRWDDTVIFENVKFTLSFLSLTRGADGTTGEKDVGTWAQGIVGQVQKSWEVKVECEGRCNEWREQACDFRAAVDEMKKSSYYRREEVCAGASSSRFRVLPVLPLKEQDVAIAKASLEDYYSGYSALPHRLIHGGTCVRFQHRRSGYVLFGDRGGAVHWVHKAYRSGASVTQGAYDSSAQQGVARRQEEEAREHSDPGCLWRVMGVSLRLGGMHIGFQDQLIQHVASGRYLGMEETGRLRLREALDGEQNHWEVVTQREGEGGEPCCSEPVRGGDAAWLRVKGGGRVGAAAAANRSVGSAAAGRSGGRGAELHRGSSLRRGASSWQMPSSGGGEGSGTAASAWLGCDTPTQVQARGAHVYASIVQFSHHPINDDVLELQLVNVEEAYLVDEMRHRNEMLKAVYNGLKQIPPVPEDIQDEEEQVTYIKRNAQKVLTPQLTRLVEINMKRMICACRSGGETDVFKLTGSPVTSVQDLLLSTGVLKLCLEIIEVITQKVKVPMALIKPRLPRLFTLCRMCYLLVEQACIDNVCCKQAVAPYFKMMQEQVRAMIGSYYAMLECLRGHRDILISLEENRFVDAITYLRRSSNAKLLAFLIEACVCGNEPLRRNQKLVTHEIHLYADMFFRTRFEGDDVIITRPDAQDETMRGFSLSILHAKDKYKDELLSDPNLKLNETEDLELRSYMYYLYLLHLFSVLLQGRNEVAHRALLRQSEQMGFAYRDLLHLLSNGLLPNSLRKVACCLITQLYVDCEPHAKITTLNKTRVWGGLWSQLQPDQSTEVQSVGAHSLAPVKREPSARPLRTVESILSHRTHSHRSNLLNSSSIRHDTFASVAYNSDEEDDLEEGFGITREVSRAKERRPSVEEILEELEADKREACNDLHVLSRAEVSTRANAGKLAELKERLVELLRQNAEIDHGNVGRNELLSSVVDLVRSLMKFGFYHKADPDCKQELICDFQLLKRVCEALIEVLDGRTDHCKPERVYRRASAGGVNVSRAFTRLQSKAGPGVLDSMESKSKDTPVSPNGDASFRIGKLNKGPSTPSGLSSSNAAMEDSTARFVFTPRTFVVMVIKNKIMEFIMDALHTVEDHRISLFVRAWNHLLKDKVKFSLFREQNAAGDEDGNESAPPSPLRANGTEEAGRSNSKTGFRFRRQFSKRASSARTAKTDPVPFSSIANSHASWASSKQQFKGMWSGRGMEAYAEDETMWVTEPIWTEEEITLLCDQLFEQAPKVSDVAESLDLRRMFEKGNATVLPEWPSILLDIVRYQCPYMKQNSIALLVKAFNVEPSFVASTLCTHILYCPMVALDYLRAIEGKQMAVRMHRLFNSEVQAERETAYEKVTDLLWEWGHLSQLSGDRGWVQVKEWQQVMVSLGVLDLALYVLAAPCERVFALEAGKLDRCRDELQAKLFQCMDNDRTQRRMLDNVELVKSHLGLDVVDADRLLGGICKNNMEIVQKIGKEWIRMLFFDLIKRYQTAKIQWLQILHYLMKCRGKPLKSNQSLVMTYFQQCEDVFAGFMITDADHDERIHLMQEVPDHADNPLPGHGQQEETKLGYHLAVFRLLALCSEGKNPAAEVYAAHYFSLSNTMKSIIALTRRGGTEEEVVVPKAVYYRVKSTFVSLLLHVFVDTKVRRLIIELEKEGNGLWECEDERIKGCKPLMEQIADELELVAEGEEEVKKREDGVDGWWEALMLYKRQSVVPLLQFYYSLHYARARGPTVAAVTRRIYDALGKIYTRAQQRLAAEEEEDAALACCLSARQAFNALRVLMQTMQKACKFDSGALQGFQTATITSGLGARSMEESMSAKVMSAIRTGFRAFVGAVAQRYGAELAADGGAMGVRKAALLLCRQGTVPMYRGVGGAGEPGPSPRYEEFGRAILEVSHYADTDAGVVCDILRLMSASIYILDPDNEGKTPAECEEAWQALRTYAPAVKGGKLAAETLEWVQNKYDAMGCTVAALRLVRHRDCQVQMRAVGLLLTLLQRGNRRVQRSIVRYIATTQDRGLLQHIAANIDAGLENLGDLKRKTKAAKSAGQVVAEEEVVMGNIRGYGRESRLMLILRLVQLLCEGQFCGLQDLMREPDDSGRTVIGRMVDLLEAIPPLLPDALAFRDGSLYILGCQIADAVSEAVQGPNYQNQEFLMGGNFLVVANRMFALLHYVPFEFDTCKSRNLGIYMNDGICWLKLSLLRCCMACVEGCVDGRQADTLMQFVELRNIQSQLLECGTLLGFVPRRSPSEAGDSSAERSVQNAYERRRKNCPVARKNWAKCQADAISNFAFSEGKEQSLEEEMFTCWFLLLTLAEFDKTGSAHETLHQIHLHYSMLEKHLQEATSDVELVRARKDTRGEKVVERVFFRVSDTVRELVRNGQHFREKATEKMFDVPRENPQEKAKLFVDRLRLVHTRVKFYVVLLKASWRGWIILHQDWIDAAPRVLSVVITALLLLLYGIPYDPNTGKVLADGGFFSSEDEIPAGYMEKEYPFANRTSDPEGVGMLYSTVMAATDLSLEYRLKLTSRWKSFEEWQGRTLLLVLAWLHVALTFINFGVYITFEMPLILSEVVDEHLRYLANKDRSDLGRHGRGAEPSDDAEEETFGLNEAINAVEAEARETEVGPPPRKPEKRELHRFFWKTMGQMNTACYLAVMCNLSLLGAFSSPFLFVPYMLDYFRTKSGRMVVQAVILGGPNLFRSFAVGIIVIVCFGFYSYAYFSDSVNHEQEVCRSPFQCVTKHILDSMTGDLTTVLGDDFGNYAFPALVLWSDSWQAWRTAFLFVSIIFWVFLLQGIIQGQIIDAFAEKRLAVAAKKQDLESKCFVTSIDRFVFTSYPGEWEKRRGGQFAWHYLLFLAYLEEKDPEEYSGLENEVSRALKRDSVAFLPVETFVAQQREQVRQGDDTLDAKVESLAPRLARIEVSLDRLSMGSHAVAAHVHGISDQFASVGPTSAPPAPAHQSGPVQLTPVRLPTSPRETAAYLMGSPRRDAEPSPPRSPPIEPIASLSSPPRSPR